MLQEQAEVTAIEGAHAWVSCRAQQDCARCAAGKGCGGGLLGKWLGDRLQRVRVSHQGDIRVGDCVVIGMDERDLVTIACLVYGVPLLAMFAGAVSAAWWAGGDAAVAVGMLAGLVLGFAWVRWFSRKMTTVRYFQPTVLHRVVSAELK